MMPGMSGCKAQDKAPRRGHPFVAGLWGPGAGASDSAAIAATYCNKSDEGVEGDAQS
jgi:hypothetical protein